MKCRYAIQVREVGIIKPIEWTARRFQHGFDQLNLHCLTSVNTWSSANQHSSSRSFATRSGTVRQWLTLVCCSAQRKRFGWDRGCI